MVDLHYYFGLDQECNFKENQKVIPTNCALLHSSLGHMNWIPSDETKRGGGLQVLTAVQSTVPG